MRLVSCSLQILCFIVTAVLGSVPLAIPWSNKSYGPDGPWQAVTINVGQNPAGHVHSQLDAHPGGTWASQINSAELCGSMQNNAPATCLANIGGIYGPSYSAIYVENASTEFSDWDERGEEAQPWTVSETTFLDTLAMGTSAGTFLIPNTTIAAMNNVDIKLPGGVTYMTEVSHLALGGPGNGSVTVAPGFLGQTFPGVLAANGTIPSNSYGLHYGSASLKTVGSLTWGGYDQSRVLGDVATYNLEDGIQNNMIPLLLDIQIGVEKGNSPFNAPSFTNLLQINASYGFNGAQPTNIDPTLPYMFMGPQTCAAIAQHLPITLQAYSGLYIWNTTDPLYSSIIKSPAYLAFVFSTSGANNLTIKIPFQLLNLTLDNPIATPPVPYFPCKPFHAADGSNHYFFGKAFLQAAFLGMNWEKSQFFLAQAPGPGAAAPNIQAIASDATTIESDPISNFAASWDQTWTPIGMSAANGNGSSNINPPLNGGSGLSGGAKAGIAVGVIVGVSAIAGLVIPLCLRRRRRGKAEAPSLSGIPEISRQEGEATTKDPFQYIPPVEKDGIKVEHELDSGDGLPQEMGAGAGPTQGKRVHELDAR